MSLPEPVEGPAEERASTSAVLSSSKGSAPTLRPEPTSTMRPEPVEGPAEQTSTGQAGTPPAEVPQLSVTDVRRLWPEVLEEVKGKRRFTWILLSQNAELRKGTLLLAMSNTGARDSFGRGGNEDVLREAIVVVMGADFAVETMVDPSATSSEAASRTSRAVPPPAGPAASALDTSASRATNGAPNAIADDPDAAASRDDSDLDENAESQTQLLARHLGAEIIAEEDHGA